MSAASRQPSGIPSGGQFAPTARARSGIALGSDSTGGLDTIVDVDTDADAYVDAEIFEQASDAQFEAALWAATDEHDVPLSRDYEAEDIEDDSREQMQTELRRFMADNAEDLDDLSPEQIGRDFWLTRNRHGGGFRTHDLGERGERLTEAAHAFGEMSFYAGDDGYLHCS